jgi:hypothetical protein
MSLYDTSKAFIVGSAALAWAIACGSSNDAAVNSNAGSNECRVGSEGCPCTAGRGCDKGLACFYPLCFKPDAAGPVGMGAGTGGQGGISGIAGAGSGISGIVTGGNAGSGATPNGGSSGVSNGGTGGSVNPDGSVAGSGGGGLGPPPSCPFPSSSTRHATESGDILGSSKDKFDAKFEFGRLVELDAKPCTIDTSGVAPAGDWGSYSCRDGYSCGGCLVFVISPSDQNALGTWFIVGAYAATNGTTPGCPEYSTAYQICAPDCAGKQCGDDQCGGYCGVGCGSGRCCTSANQCVVDTCAECASACSGIPGCSCASQCPGPC